jgi:hypothetical protein
MNSTQNIKFWKLKKENYIELGFKKNCIRIFVQDTVR